MDELTYLLVCIFWCISTLQAQDYTVSGALADSTNLKTLPGATISLTKNEDTIFKYYGTTDHNGDFKLFKAKLGNYSLWKKSCG
jgi:hypothetical protein